MNVTKKQFFWGVLVLIAYMAVVTRIGSFIPDVWFLFSMFWFGWHSGYVGRK